MAKVVFSLGKTYEPVTIAVPQKGGGYRMEEHRLVMEHTAIMEQGKPTEHETLLYVENG